MWRQIEREREGKPTVATTCYSYQLAVRGILHAPSVRDAHTTAIVTPVVEHWLE